jgi:hypothetical protein
LGYKVDQQGKRIVSKVNPAFIKQIAQEANGYAILAANSFPNLEECYQLIHKQSTEATANNPSEKIDVKENSYRIPLLLGLLLLLVYCFQPTIRLSKMKN